MENRRIRFNIYLQYPDESTRVKRVNVYTFLCPRSFLRPGYLQLDSLTGERYTGSYVIHAIYGCVEVAWPDRIITSLNYS